MVRVRFFTTIDRACGAYLVPGLAALTVPAMELRRITQAQMPLARPFRAVEDSNIATTARSTGVSKAAASEVVAGIPVVPPPQRTRRRASRRDAERFETYQRESRGRILDQRR
jgi:hypothetical protein